MKKETTWKSTTTSPPPEGVYVLIKTKTGLVRVGKLMKYPDGSEEFMYSSQDFKHVLWWQPLPK